MLHSQEIRQLQDVQTVPKRMTTPPVGYIDVEEAARLAGISRSSAYDMSKVGGRWESEGVTIYRPTKRGRWIRRDTLLAWVKKLGGPVPPTEGEKSEAKD